MNWPGAQGHLLWFYLPCFSSVWFFLIFQISVQMSLSPARWLWHLKHLLLQRSILFSQNDCNHFRLFIVYLFPITPARLGVPRAQVRSASTYVLCAGPEVGAGGSLWGYRHSRCSHRGYNIYLRQSSGMEVSPQSWLGPCSDWPGWVWALACQSLNWVQKTKRWDSGDLSALPLAGLHSRAHSPVSLSWSQQAAQPQSRFCKLLPCEALPYQRSKSKNRQYQTRDTLAPVGAG